MKKILSLILAFVMALGLTGCSNELADAVVNAAIDIAVDALDDSNEYQDALEEIGGPDGPAVTFHAVIGDEETNAESTDGTDNTVESQPSQPAEESPSTTNSAEEKSLIDEDGYYYSKEDVSLYLVTYGELPDNYITKDEARDLGWTGGSVEDYAPGYAIGGDVFQNKEGLLPKAMGRTYYECDIDTDGYYSRGSRRIVFSNDGLIYYTHDHYESFELLYGEE